MKRYFKFRWNENRGDQWYFWGFSTWYIEIDEHFYPTRQIELYDNGKKLQYNEQNFEDEFGGLSNQKFDIKDFEGVECEKEEFEQFWK